MFDQELLDLEKLVRELEEKVQNDDEDHSSDEFQRKYETVIRKEMKL